MRTPKQAQFVWLTVRDTAKRLGLSVSGVKWLLKHGHLKGIKFGNAWMVSLDSILKYETRRAKAGRSKSRRNG